MRGSLIIAICCTALLLSGCITTTGQPQKPFGFKDTDDCRALSYDDQKLPCYHVAAVSSAYLSSLDPNKYSSDAIAACEDIVNVVGSAHPDDDIGKQADTERNLCMFDVAKIVARETGDPNLATNICSNIRKGSYETALTGSDATKESCDTEVQKLAKITASNYYQTDNLCTVVFVMPPLLLLSIYFYRKN